VRCQLLIQVLLRIHTPYYLYNNYNAILLSTLLIIYTSIIVHLCSVCLLLFIQLLYHIYVRYVSYYLYNCYNPFSFCALIIIYTNIISTFFISALFVGYTTVIAH